MSNPRPRYFESPVMTVKECAAFLQVHPSGIYRLVRRHAVPSFKIGRHWRFSKDEIVRWLEKLGADEKAKGYPPR
jgi:excisionase family DNA binding protein